MDLINVRRLLAGLVALLIAVLVWFFGQRAKTMAGSRSSPAIAAADPQPLLTHQPKAGVRKPVRYSHEALREASQRAVLHIERSMKAIDEVLEETDRF